MCAVTGEVIHHMRGIFIIFTHAGKDALSIAAIALNSRETFQVAWKIHKVADARTVSLLHPDTEPGRIFFFLRCFRHALARLHLHPHGDDGALLPAEWVSVRQRALRRTQQSLQCRRRLRGWERRDASMLTWVKLLPSGFAPPAPAGRDDEGKASRGFQRADKCISTWRS